MSRSPFSYEEMPVDDYATGIFDRFIADAVTTRAQLEEAACRAALRGNMGVRIEDYFDGTAIFITPDVPAREMETWRMETRSIRDRRPESPYPPAA